MSVERLTAEDQLMVRASEVWPQHIGALAILDGDGLLDATGHLRIEAVRGAIQGRLHLVPRLRQLIQVPRRGLGGPLWVDAPRFDIAEHVRVMPLGAHGDEAALLLAIERLRQRRLDPTRPGWEMWFLTGLPERHIGLYVSLHHAIADGMAAMTAIAAFLDTSADGSADGSAAPAPPWRPLPPPSAPELLGDTVVRAGRRFAGAVSTLARPRRTLMRIRAAWPATRELVGGAPAARTSLDRMVGPARTLAVVRTTLDDVRRIAHSGAATVNDVLLAVTAGGLRALLRSRGEPIEDTTVRIYVPVSLRRRSGSVAVQGNQIAQMVVPLPLGGSDPVRGLRQIAAETAERKARTRASLGILFRGRIARLLMLRAVIRQRVCVTSASIQGPELPLYLAGARVREVWPVLPLIGNVALGVGALSYAGTFSIGIVADRDAYPDLDVFVAGVREALRALGGSATDGALAVVAEGSGP